MDLSSILNDQELVESSTDLSSKDILKRCENLVKSKVKKSHSLGDLYADTGNSNSNGSNADGSRNGAVNGNSGDHHGQYATSHHPHHPHHPSQVQHGHH